MVQIVTLLHYCNRGDDSDFDQDHDTAPLEEKAVIVQGRDSE